MSDVKRETLWIAALVASALIAGSVFGWYLTRPAPVVETHAKQETQADGSVVVERQPDPKAKSAHKTPKGAKVERVGTVTVQGQTPPEIQSCTKTPCPPVTVNTSLVRLPDGSKRVIVSSPDGQIVGGVDVPVETAAPPPEPPKWAAGVSLNPHHQTFGVWVERDLMRLRVGAEINQTRTDHGAPVKAEARVRLGWTF